MDAVVFKKKHRGGGVKVIRKHAANTIILDLLKLVTHLRITVIFSVEIMNNNKYSVLDVKDIYKTTMNHNNNNHKWFNSSNNGNCTWGFHRNNGHKEWK